MFGLKLISKKKYDRIIYENENLSLMAHDLQIDKDNLYSELASMKYALEKAKQFNAEKAREGGCFVGPWCEDCIHKRYIGGNGYRATNYFEESCIDFVSKDIYCAKHIHDICPEWTCEKE